MVEGVLFDFRHTLVDVRQGYAEAESYLFDALAKQVQELERESFDGTLRAVRATLEKKFYDKKDVHDLVDPFLRDVLHIYKIVLTEDGFQELRDGYDKAFTDHVELYPDARFMLHLLEKLGIKIGVVIDGIAQRERRIIRLLNIEYLLDVVVISEEVGATTSSSVPWERAIQLMKLEPASILIVGDRLDKDILHGQKLSCMTALLKRGDGDGGVANVVVTPTLIIHSLKDLITRVQWGGQ